MGPSQEAFVQRPAVGYQPSLPNILLIAVDCARSDAWLEVRPDAPTPNLTALRREGVTVPACIAETSGTTPNFATLLSGLYSPRHGVRLILGRALGGDVPLLTDELAGRGYHTYAEVTGPLIADIGMARGFERYTYRAPCDYLHTAWGDRFVEGLRTGAYKPPWFILLHLWETHLPREIDPAVRKRLPRASDYEAAVASLDAQLGRVFEAAGPDAFLVVTGDHGEKLRGEHYAPGTAVEYIRSYLGLDRARGVSLNRISGWMGPSTLHHLLAEFVEPRLEAAGREGRVPRASFLWPRRIADRVRLMRLLPRIGPSDLPDLRAPLKLTAWMHERGILDERRSRDKARRFLEGRHPEVLDAMFTRILISSLKANLEEGHILHVYDALVRVPLVMRWKPRLPAGLIFPHMVRQPDILPTILDLIGSAPHGSRRLDGRSFRPLFEGGKWRPRPAFLSTGGYLSQVEIRGVRTPGWKYTHGPFNAAMPEELYDLRRDPAETRNLAPERPGACARMKRLLGTFSFPNEGPGDLPASAGGPGRRRTEQVLKGLGYLD
jgi:arylsulfatase A-like enzyme